MSCEHEIRFTIKPTDDACRFHFDVRAYKDRIVAPDEYSGVTVVTPSDSEQVLETKDKLVRDDITVLPAPTEVLSTTSNGTFTPSSGKVGFSQVSVDVNPDLRPLTIDSLTQQGTFLPTSDGFSQVTAEEDWDGTLYPITDDPDKIFNAKWIPVQDGDRIIVEGYGRGRYVGTNGNNKIDTNTFPTTMAINVLPSPYFFKLRWEGTVRTLANDANVILAGYQWVADGTHSTNSTYQFRGEYLKWKVIHAS